MLNDILIEEIIDRLIQTTELLGRSDNFLNIELKIVRTTNLKTNWK